MTAKIGFVDSDDPPEYRKSPLGRIKDQAAERRAFWQSLIVDFLLAFGALALLKEILLFLMHVKDQS